MRIKYIFKNKITGLYFKHEHDDVPDIEQSDKYSITKYLHFFVGDTVFNYDVIEYEKEKLKILRIKKLLEL